jgi:hypothetical protein
MRAITLFAAIAALTPWAAPWAMNALAQTIGPVDPGAHVNVSSPKSVTINGVSGVRVREAQGAYQGYMVPDGKGGYVHYDPGKPPTPPPASRGDAEEVRLYARELASQISMGVSGQTPLAGVVSVPTAFVDLDTRSVTPFGRLMGEQMIYELSSRGFPVKEVRGGAALSPKPKGKKAPAETVAVLAGSYYADRDNVFVNARLVEPSGRVVRTGSVLIPMTSTMRRMLGIPDYYGFNPTPPTLIGSRDVNDPPGSGVKTPAPYAPSPKTSASSGKSSKAKAKAPCPPGCEPIDTAAAQPEKTKKGAAKDPATQAAQQAVQPQQGAPQAQTAQPAPKEPAAATAQPKK